MVQGAALPQRQLRAPLCGLLLLAAGGTQALALAWPWAGALLPQGQPLAWLQWAGLLLLVPLLRAAPSWRAAAVYAWWFALVWLAGTFWWLFISMHTYGGLPAALAVLAVLALAGFLALFYAAAGAAFWHWRGATPAVQALAFAACWTLAELARGRWLTGFPWGAGGYALVDALGALAPYVGVYGLGALSAAAAALLSAFVPWRGRVGPALAASAAPATRWLGAGTVAARGWALVLGAGWLWLLAWPGAGAALWQVLPLHTTSTGPLAVTLLQGNIAQDEKFQAGSGVPDALNWYGQQLRAAVAPVAPAVAADPALAGQGADALSAATAVPRLVLAPETAIPLLPQDMDPAYWRSLLNAIASGDAAVMLGLPLGSLADGYTNSVAGWTPGALDFHRYDKHHLVPFGEFIPPLFRWFTNLMHIPLGDFNRGTLAQPPLLWGGQRMAPNICYEDLFGEELAAGFIDRTRAPTVLVNVSNIGWFGDSVAIDQHRHISRMRALELQRPMLRATNTGATAVINHLGQVTHELPRLTRAVLHAQAEGRTGLTPYARWASRWGLGPLWAAGGLVLLLLWRRRRTT